MNRHMSAAIAAVLAVAGGCKDKSADAPAAGDPTAKLGATPGAESASNANSAMVAPAGKSSTPITGDSIAPVITHNITFYVPKDAAWWGELSFPCYDAIMSLQPGTNAADAFTQISPKLAPALAAADIDIGKDVSAMGAWGCGDGLCAYSAVALRHPDRIPAMLEALVGGGTAKTIAPGHYSIPSPDASGAPREIDVRVVPVAWPDKVPGDSWSTDAARATHVVFITGLKSGAAAADAMASKADPAAALAIVKDAETSVTDTHAMCIRGGVFTKRDFQPGYSLEHARFAVAAPEGDGDPITRLVGSKRSLDLDVELTLSPAPTQTPVDSWIAEARAWGGQIAAPIRQQYAASAGPMVDAMFEAGSLVVNKGFQSSIKDKVWNLSWRTNRVPESDLTAIESKLGSLMLTK